MLSVERILANVRAVDHIVRRRIPGDVVERGVWRGGSSMAMAMGLRGRSDTQRTLWMYDTYEGMTDPTDADKVHYGNDAKELMKTARQDEKPENSLILAAASLEVVQNNMRSTGYPVDRIRYVKGPVEETIPGSLPDRIALLRIDTDWYESTRHELVHLYPRLSSGGILIIDDYGHWQGARKAVDEYFQGSGPFLNRIDYTGRLAVKP
ncbi:MAG: class I SAM-dependent methyltransferase [Silvibacterium sp.]|nr:class I SAM-dependent methyltransferase [Silvibacterium sp.]MBV8631534.1 class I SAM-dependent methyltransferase [Silvibacterium sp.]